MPSFPLVSNTIWPVSALHWSCATDKLCVSRQEDSAGEVPLLELEGCWSDFCNNDGGILISYCNLALCPRVHQPFNLFLFFFFPSFLSLFFFVVEVCKISKGQQHLCWNIILSICILPWTYLDPFSDLCRKSPPKNYYPILNVPFSFMQVSSSPQPLFQPKEIVRSCTCWYQG